MKVTVTEIDVTRLDTYWERLKIHIAQTQPDLLLLPEMPFSPWFCATDDVRDVVWEQAEASHSAWIARLNELGVPVVCSSAPRTENGSRRNAAFVWTADGGVRYVHDKTYLPDEPGFWEATWYERGPVKFDATAAGGVSVGFMICTEIWFLEHARAYGKQGVHFILNPRSVEATTTDKWLAGGRVVGVIAGAFCLSSNHAETSEDMQLGGTGWVTGPDGHVLATTTQDAPFVTVEVDVDAADAAKSTYPRYVKE